MRKQDLRNIETSKSSDIHDQEGRSGNPEARDQCRLGNLYAQSMIYEYAVDAYKRAIQLDPDYATAHHNLGAVYYKMGLFDEAHEELETAINIRPDVSLFHYTLGLVLKDDKRLDDCIESFSKAISLKPDYVDALYHRGAAFFYINEIEKACLDLEKVVAIDPQFRDAIYNLGVIYISLKRWEDARKAFERQLEFEPSDPDILYYLALINTDYDNNNEFAIKKLKEILELDPDHLNAQFLLALIYARGRYRDPVFRQNAVNQLLNIIDVYEEYHDFDDIHNVFFLLGSIFDDDSADIDLAIEAYEKGLTFADWSAEAHNNLGVLYSEKEQIDKAVREFREAIKLDPDYASPYHNLAKIYFYQRNEEIVKDFQQWIEQVTDESAKILSNLSLALMDIGRAEACESIYSKAHGIKNLIGVAGSKLRRVCRESEGNSADKLQEVLSDQEKCYDEMVSLLGTLKHESLVLDMVDINDIIISVANQIGFRSEDGKPSGKLCCGSITCDIELDADLPMVKGDARRLKEAFNNIIINSMEAMNSEGLMHISARYLDLASEVEIRFRDSGIGIAHKDIDNIFKPGYTTKDHGSGFGLSIVNRIIRDHKGNIFVSSQENEGTEIGIHIPVNLEMAPIQTSLRMRPVIYEDPSKLISTEVDQIVEA